MQNTMIPLTVANTLDQTTKQRIEAKPNQTLKQAVQAQNLAPQGAFDVYDQLGKVISNANVANHRDATVYVGVAKVAGGALRGGLDLDDDDDGWDLDGPAPLVKPREVTFILQNGERHTAQPNPNELLIQTYERVLGRPRDGSTMEIYDNDGGVVSSRNAHDMVGRSFRVGLRQFPGGAFGAKRGKGSSRPISPPSAQPYPAKVPKEIIEQTTAFTQPRGRLEMGGLLIGHVDHEGNNVVVCGFFPRQDEASSGYCEFSGSFNAIASAACDFANERAGGPHTPPLRIIGWIHTHPDIGIFLSGIDVNTFGILRRASFEQRSVAVVVDPLREEHGVYVSEKKANNRDAEQAKATVVLSEDLEARYHKFLNRMRSLQNKMGKEELPFILPGVLYQQRKAMGDVDDVMEAKLQALDKLYRQSVKDAESMREMRQRLQVAESSLQHVERVQRQQAEKMATEIHSLRTKLGLAESKIRSFQSRDTMFKTAIERQNAAIRDITDLVAKFTQLREEPEAVALGGTTAEIPNDDVGRVEPEIVGNGDKDPCKKPQS
jgi:proteasome lid subunit RPN8/RPN11